ncbi:MAG: hypothetical protein OEW09_00785 [Anaerolineae bacterium]|nr:hypothetical protein [Anaerolineae bacterium]
MKNLSEPVHKDDRALRESLKAHLSPLPAVPDLRPEEAATRLEHLVLENDAPEKKGAGTLARGGVPGRGGASGSGLSDPGGALLIKMLRQLRRGQIAWDRRFFKQESVGVSPVHGDLGRDYRTI